MIFRITIDDKAQKYAKLYPPKGIIDHFLLFIGNGKKVHHFVAI
jgi:hypothetical protein